MGKQSTIKFLFCALPLICAVTAGGITRQDNTPDNSTGRTPTMRRLWQNRNERTGSVSIKTSKRSHSLSGQHQPAPGELYPKEEWAIWYADTFDRDSPPSVDVKGFGLVEGLTQLWARHLFESVRPDGQSGFSTFHLKWRQGRVEINGDREGAKRLRGWLFGKKESSYKGYAAEADPALLKKVAVAHAHLIESGEKAEQILTIARAAKDGADFSNRLDGLIKK
ncbi:MAG TPA: hypothetical protein VIQ24_23955 [Pyrinomonadaceae bacterium]